MDFFSERDEENLATEPVPQWILFSSDHVITVTSPKQII